jgi:hypothetical protein
VAAELPGDGPLMATTRPRHLAQPSARDEAPRVLGLPVGQAWVTGGAGVALWNARCVAYVEVDCVPENVQTRCSATARPDGGLRPVHAKSRSSAPLPVATA